MQEKLRAMLQNQAEDIQMVDEEMKEDAEQNLSFEKNAFLIEEDLMLFQVRDATETLSPETTLIPDDLRDCVNPLLLGAAQNGDDGHIRQAINFAQRLITLLYAIGECYVEYYESLLQCHHDFYKEEQKSEKFPTKEY